MALRAIIFREEMSRYFFNMTASVFGKIVLLGAGAGLATWLIGWVLNQYILTPFFCGDPDSISICLNSTVISSNIAAVLVGIMVVPILAMISMKRALLVVIAAIVALWGVAAWIAGPWYVSLIWTVLAYAAVYAALAWINRLRGDLAAIVFIVMFVVIVRAVLAFA